MNKSNEIVHNIYISIYIYIYKQRRAGTLKDDAYSAPRILHSSANSNISSNVNLPFCVMRDMYVRCLLLLSYTSRNRLKSTSPFLDKFRDVLNSCLQYIYFLTVCLSVSQIIGNVQMYKNINV